MSRYPPPDSGGDSRRSPHRDRSPQRYNDGPDRAPFNGAPRENNYRPAADGRNTNNFAARENYRETGRDLISNFQSREPPRGPKASLGDKPPLSDIPSGPRGSFSHEAPGSYRGGFGGPPRRGGAEYRNNSRDRAPPPVRDLDRDFRERRGPPSPERFNNNAPDRDFDDRNRFDRRESNYRGDSFRGRGDSFRGRGRGRAISPRGRERSPLRDDRGPPLRSRGGGAWQQRGGGGYRGRGGGRGGYFSDSRSDVGVGRRRSRSPDREPFRPYNRRPDEIDVKPPPIRPYSSVGISAPREHPSPPPQAPEVPAFGTVVQNNIPNGPGQHSTPATPVAIPTGPRSQRAPFETQREPYQRGTTIRTETELIWTANNHSAAPPTAPRSIAAPSQSPVELFQQRRVQSVEPGYGRGGYGFQRSPQMQSRPVSRDSGAGARRQESIDREKQEQQHDVHMMEAGEVDETPAVKREPTPPPPKKVESITLVRRPTGVDMSFLDKQSDSDLEDDLGPEYFEKEIQAVKQEIKQATLKNATEDNIFHYEFLVANYTDELRAPVIPAPLPPLIPPKAEVVAKPPVVTDRETDAPTPMQLDNNPPATAASVDQPTPSIEMGAEQSTARAKSPQLATPSNELAGLAISPKNKSPPKSKLSLALPDDAIGEESAAEEAQILEAVHKRMATPPPESLPFRPLSPPASIEMYDVDHVDDVMDYIVEELVEKAEQRQKDIEQEIIIYKKLYKDWILFHHSNHEMAVKVRQKWEASRIAEVSRAASVAPEKDNKPEGRSRGRFATEHDMERILKLSEVEAREARARSDRAAKAKLANEKEAVIPDMLSPEERRNDKYGDYTNRVSPERALAVFQVLPPIPDFTDQERNIFEATMLEYPKQWTKIANQLPGRNYKHVIQYYYLVKHELKLKEKLKRGLKGRRKKRVAKTSVHTVALGRDEDPEDPPPVIEEGGTRRRPKRAAAPTFGAGSGTNANAETAGPSESEGATPAPTSRRGAGTPKGEANGDAPTTGRRKGKQAKERALKQAKNTQLLAAATSNDAQRKNREETKVPAPIPMQEWKIPRQGPPEPEQLGFHQPQLHQVGGYDGGEMRPQTVATHTPPNPMIDRAPPALAPYEVPAQYGAPEQRNPVPINAYDQQTQRSMAANNNGAPTSSYWSVSEAEAFPALLKHFGTEWHLIAKWMGSKTHIMVYTTVFQDWLTVPSDSNKSRRVANLAEQVKNYYQRQVDQGGKPQWEAIAMEADEKLKRGESTGPPPIPSHNPVKRKYDGLPGESPSRGPGGVAGMNPEELEEMWGNGPTQQQPPLKFGGMPGTGRFDSFTPLPSRAGTLGTFEIDTKRISSHQHSIAHDPSPQPGVQRFQPLAQAGQMPESRSAPQAKILPQQPQQHLPQQMQQQQPGPQRGYFNVSQDRRPILHARSSHNSVASHGSPHPESSAHRSQAAKAMEEAHAEQQRAQRLIEDQAEAERIRMGQQQGQMSGRMPMKQEPDGQQGLPPHLSPHVRDLRDIQGEPMQGVQQGIPPQHRMGQRHDGGSQPISPMRPEDRRPVQQPPMPGYGQPFRGPQHPSQAPQQIQSQRDPRMESKMGITSGPSTPIIAAHAPIQQPHPGMRDPGIRGNTMSAPPQQQGGQPHVHAHHHHVHQHGMQGRHPQQGGPILQGQPGGLGQHQAPQHQGQMAQMHPQQAPTQPRPEAAPARKSNLFSLLNNDDEPTPKTPQPKPVPSPVPFAQGQGYAPSNRMSTAGPPQQGQMGPRGQEHMLRREPSHPDIRQAQSQDLRGGPPPQEMRPGGQRRENMPPGPQVRGHEGAYPEERQRVPNPQAQQNLIPQQARSHAGSHAGSPMEGPREMDGGIDRSRLVRDERGMIRGEGPPLPRDPRDPRDIPGESSEMPRDPREAQDARMRGPPIDDRERERDFYHRQEDERRRQMMMQQQQQQRQDAEMQGQRQAQGPGQGHPNNGSQSAVNSPLVGAYQAHPRQMGQQPQGGPGAPQQGGHRQGMFGREQLGHGSRHSSFDGRERQMAPGNVASQGPPTTSGYVTSHPGQGPPQHPAEQRGFPPQSQQGPAPPRSAPPRFDGQGPPPGQGPERGAFGAQRQGERQEARVVNAKAVANNQYAPVYATREQVAEQMERERRQAEARARGEPMPVDQRPIDPRDRDMRDGRDGRPDQRFEQRPGEPRLDPKDPRGMAQPPRDPRDIPRDLRDERALNDPRDPRAGDPRLIAPPRDSPRSYQSHPMMPGQEVRGGPEHRGMPGQEVGRGPGGHGLPAIGAFGFGGSAEEMRERERLLQREREAEMEVNARLAREGGFGRR